MKFLCMKCDEPMKLVRTAPPDRGSLSVVYSCPSCAHQIAMLTNPYETQLVQSLGVRIGPAEGVALAGPVGTGPGSPEHGAPAGFDSAGGDPSKCPFSSVIQEIVGAGSGTADGIVWTPEARARLGNIPEFARPMAEIGIEKFARDNGRDRIDEHVMDEAKSFFGM